MFYGYTEFKDCNLTNNICYSALVIIALVSIENICINTSHSKIDKWMHIQRMDTEEPLLLHDAGTTTGIE